MTGPDFTSAPDPKTPRRKQDRLRQLRAFSHTARLRSISRAAETLASSQPAVSRQVRAIEEEFAVELFKRSGPHIALTPAGERLLELAAPLVEEIDRLPDTFDEQYRGVASDTLTIAAGETTAAAVLPAWTKRFRDRYPGTSLEVKTGDGPRRIGLLRSYEVDLVVAAVDVPPPDMEFHPVFTSENMLITPLDHPLVGRESIEFKDVAGVPVVAHHSGIYVRELAELISLENEHVTSVVLEVNGWLAIKRYVEAGLGIAVVPDLCLRENDRVWRYPVGQYYPMRTYGLLTRRDGIVSLAARRFMEIADPSLADGSPGEVRDP